MGGLTTLTPWRGRKGHGTLPDVPATPYLLFACNLGEFWRLRKTRGGVFPPPHVPMGKTSPCVVMTSCCAVMGRTHTLVGGPYLCHKESSKLMLESRLDLSV